MSERAAVLVHHGGRPRSASKYGKRTAGGSLAMLSRECFTRSAHPNGRRTIRCSSTILPPMRCSVMIRSNTGGSHAAYHVPSG
jgi:hypothetical protein